MLEAPVSVRPFRIYEKSIHVCQLRSSLKTGSTNKATHQGPMAVIRTTPRQPGTKSFPAGQREPGVLAVFHQFCSDCLGFSLVHRPIGMVWRRIDRIELQ